MPSSTRDDPSTVPVPGDYVVMKTARPNAYSVVQWPHATTDVLPPETSRDVAQSLASDLAATAKVRAWEMAEGCYYVLNPDVDDRPMDDSLAKLRQQAADAKRASEVLIARAKDACHAASRVVVRSIDLHTQLNNGS